MPLEYDLYLLPRDVYSDLEYTPAPAFQTSYGVRSENQGHVRQKSVSFLDRKWTRDDNVANNFLKSSAQFSLEQHYNAETTLRRNISSSKLCLLDEESSNNSGEKSTKQNRKRKVSFADSQGLPLVSVHFVEDISDYLCGNRYFGYNNRNQYTDSNNNVEKKQRLSPCFEQPVSNFSNFLQQLEENSIALENIMIDERVVRGTVKVKNVAFNKKVRVRCTYDNWNSHTDIPTSHASSCGYSNTDTFTFEFTVTPCISKVEFALQYLVTDREFWDNNGGQNYKLQR